MATADQKPHVTRFAVRCTLDVDGSHGYAPYLTGLGVHLRLEVEPAFLTQAEVAVLLGVPERSLERRRLTKFGPPWLKLGRQVEYDRDDVLAWARGQRHD